MTDGTPVADDQRLPDGAVLVHIGPHKTGTTALQASLYTAREALERQGVHHAGGSRNPARAVQAVTGQVSAFGSGTPSIRHWSGLVRDIRRAYPQRVVLSSEFLAHAELDTIRRIVGELGGDRVHVVTTLRPLARIIPSMWQQNVKTGRTIGLDDWLHRLFPVAGERRATAFWHLHRHDQLIERWADVVGWDRVTAVVVDERDRDAVLRAFERLLLVRDGTLQHVPSLANRSLTAEEAEALRAFNVAYARAGHDKALYARAVRFGAAQHLCRLEPPPGTGPIRLPDWVLDPVASASREIVAAIRASGIRVIGDLDTLAAVPEPRGAADVPPPNGVSPEIAARLSMGIAIASGRARSADAVGAEVDEALATVASSQLVAAVVARARTPAERIRQRGTRAARLAADVLTGTVRSAAARKAAGGAADGQPALLPPGALLLHIGPPKTGTTAVQGAFHASRAELERQGVHYAGRRRHSIPAVLAALGRKGFFTDDPPPMRHWHRLCAETRRTRAGRVVLSSEFFADGTPDRIRAIVDDLGTDRVHVVVTLRPLARIIPSQWQQYIQSGARTAYEPWLDAMLNKPPGKLSPSFWQRHRVDALIARWADVVGTGRVTAIVLDETDRTMVLRTFERLLGLRDGTLPLDDDVANRSLTAPEIEAVRVLNRHIIAAGLSRGFQSAVVHFGATEYLKRVPPDPSSAKVDLPGWAVPRVGEIQAGMVTAIAGSGVTVIGDLDRLREVRTSGRSGFEGDAVQVPVAAAGHLAMGVMYATGLATQPAPGRTNTRMTGGRVLLPVVEPVEIARVPTRRLVHELADRSRSVVKHRLRPAGRDPRPGP